MSERELSPPKSWPRKDFDRPLHKTNRFARLVDIPRGPRAQAIFEFRMQTGMTRRELALKMRANLQSIFFWERGQLEPHTMCWYSFRRVRDSHGRQKRRMAEAMRDSGPPMVD